MAVAQVAEDIGAGIGVRSLLRKLCFIAFGVSAVANLADKFNAVNIVCGMIIGLTFGWLCTLFLSGFLGILNPGMRKQYGRSAAPAAVERGMIFLVPFAVMALLATFYMGWTVTGGFVAAGLMTAGVSAATEVGRLKGQQQIKNTILTSVVAWLFSTLWLLSAGYLAMVPGYVQGGAMLISTVVGNPLK